MMRIAAFAGHGIAERLARHRLAEHGKGEGVVFARPGGLGAAQRIAVHRRAIESRHVERRDEVGGQHSTRGVLRAERLSASSSEACRSIHSRTAGHFASPAKPCMRTSVADGMWLEIEAPNDRGRDAIHRRVPNEPDMLT